MTQKQRKQFATTIGICSLLIFLGGCSQQGAAVTVDTSTTKQVVPTTRVQTKPSVSKTVTPAPVQNVQKLVINNGCIGCGRCVAVARNTFAMQGSRAQVISQAYVQSASVKDAVAHCPVSAITIIEA